MDADCHAVPKGLLTMIDDFRRQFFADTERHTLTFDITSDDWDALCRWIEENAWERDAGLRYILAAGVAYLQARADLPGLNHPDADLAAEVHRLRRELIDLASKYAVMKFHAFHLSEEARILEMKLNGCEAQKGLLQKAIALLRQQRSQRQP